LDGCLRFLQGEFDGGDGVRRRSCCICLPIRSGSISTEFLREEDTEEVPSLFSFGGGDDAELFTDVSERLPYTGVPRLFPRCDIHGEDGREELRDHGTTGRELRDHGTTGRGSVSDGR
jgi:hypothetical protein